MKWPGVWQYRVRRDSGGLDKRRGDGRTTSAKISSMAGSEEKICHGTFWGLSRKVGNPYSYVDTWDF